MIGFRYLFTYIYLHQGVDLSCKLKTREENQTVKDASHITRNLDILA